MFRKCGYKPCKPPQPTSTMAKVTTGTEPQVPSSPQNRTILSLVLPLGSLRHRWPQTSIIQKDSVFHKGVGTGLLDARSGS